jgi:hypothetical protein
MGWISKELRFGSWHGYEIFLLARVSRLALGLTQLLIQLVPVLFFISLLVLQLRRCGAIPPFLKYLSSYAQGELIFQINAVDFRSVNTVVLQSWHGSLL